MLKTYEREGSDFLDMQSEQRRKSIKERELKPIEKNKDNNGFKIYRPKIQLIVDYVLMVPFLCILLVRIGVTPLSKECEVVFSRFVAPKASMVLVFYCFKPFIITFLSKISGFTN
jgi:hypothetical protein